MKKIIPFVGLALFAFQAFSQDLPQSQVPSLVLNTFGKNFPNASDVEWELKGDQYKVEFETGFFKDHSAWYDQTGKLLKHKEDISKNDLPTPVMASINKGYSGFSIDDVERITSNNVVTYKLELKKFTQEWKMVFDAQGKELEKIAD